MFRISCIIFLLQILSVFNNCRAQCDHPDYEGLMQLYNATKGESWSNNSGWREGAEGSACNPCAFNPSWEGVTCNNERVVKVFLTNKRLNGELPNLKLDKLEELTLNNNDLEGQLPDFTHMTSLKKLHLTNNEISGEIPNWNNLTSLEDLSISNNEIESIDQNFSIPSLVYLYIRDNMISSKLPSLGGMVKLRILDAQVNQFIGELPLWSSLVKLESIKLNDNQLTGVVPNFDLPKLETLILDNNLLVKLEDFNALPLIEDVSVQSNNLSGIIPSMNHCPALVHYNISDNQYSSDLPDLGLHPNAAALSFLAEHNNLQSCIPIGLCSLGSVDLLGNSLLPGEGQMEYVCSGLSQNKAPCQIDGLTQGTINEDCQCVEADCSDFKQDYDALMALYHSTNGPEWNKKQGWFFGAAEFSCNPCYFEGQPWYGVTCEYGRVVCVDLDGDASCNIAGLSGNNLSGTFPAMTLDSLKQLFIDGNNIEGELIGMSGLPNLETFHCSFNALSGPLPNMNDVPKLTNFRGSYNNFTGTLPDFDVWDQFETFSCSNNQLRGCYTEGMCNIDLFHVATNLELPWSGNHEPFCAGEDQFNAPCNEGLGIYGIDDDCVCAALSSTDELSQANKLFANPFNTNIVVPELEPGTRFEIHNFHGQMLISDVKGQINTEAWPPGVYIVTLYELNQLVSSQKLVKLNSQ